MALTPTMSAFDVAINHLDCGMSESLAIKGWVDIVGVKVAT